jgi:hypothetical protein
MKRRKEREEGTRIKTKKRKRNERLWKEVKREVGMKIKETNFNQITNLLTLSE